MTTINPAPFFNGLEWHIYNHGKLVSAWKDKVFEDYYVLDFAYSGKIEWAVDDAPLQWLTGPVVFWTFPGPRFRFGRRDNGTWDHYFVAFRGPRARQYAESGLLPISTKPAWRTLVDAERFRLSFEELLNELDRPVRDHALTVHLLEGLLLQLHHSPLASITGQDHDKRLRALMDQLMRYPAGKWNFENEARKVALSYPHFRRLFKALSGLPPHRFLLKTRMDYAARKLRGSDEEIKNIARSTGVEDLYHFSKLFKEFYNVPPGRYRKMAREA